MMETVKVSGLRKISSASSLTHLFGILASGELALIQTDSVFVKHDGISDCNDAIKFGHYWPMSGCLNCPPGRTPNTSDMILYLGRTAIYGRQVYIPLGSSGPIYFRTISGGTWTDWVKTLPPS